MVGSDLARGVLFGAGAAAIIVDAPPGVVYGISGLIMIAATAFRPAQAAVMPSLTHSAKELTAANVVSSTVESVGFFLGPALGGLLLAATSAEVVFVASGLTCVWSALMLLGVRSAAPEQAADAAARPGSCGRPSPGSARWRTTVKLALIVASSPRRRSSPAR